MRGRPTTVARRSCRRRSFDGAALEPRRQAPVREAVTGKRKGGRSPPSSAKLACDGPIGSTGSRMTAVPRAVAGALYLQRHRKAVRCANEAQRLPLTVGQRQSVALGKCRGDVSVPVGRADQIASVSRHDDEVRRPDGWQDEGDGLGEFVPVTRSSESTLDTAAYRRSTLFEAFVTQRIGHERRQAASANRAPAQCEPPR